jgi:hypothetical protein
MAAKKQSKSKSGRVRPAAPAAFSNRAINGCPKHAQQ